MKEFNKEHFLKVCRNIGSIRITAKTLNYDIDYIIQVMTTDAAFAGACEEAVDLFNKQPKRDLIREICQDCTTLKEACNNLNITESKFRNWVKYDPELKIILSNIIKENSPPKPPPQKKTIKKAPLFPWELEQRKTNALLQKQKALVAYCACLSSFQPMLDAQQSAYLIHKRQFYVKMRVAELVRSCMLASKDDVDMLFDTHFPDDCWQDDLTKTKTHILKALNQKGTLDEGIAFLKQAGVDILDDLRDENIEKACWEILPFEYYLACAKQKQESHL